MGISLEQWRGKIGCFNQPKKCKTRLNVLVVHLSMGLRSGLRMAICLAAILIICGDVEQNPGPPKSTTDRSRRGNPTTVTVQDSASADATPRRVRSFVSFV